MPTRGTDEYAVAEFKNDVICSGFTEVFIRSDNEPAILALEESTATALKLAGVNVKIEESAMNAEEASRKRSAESAGHEADDAGRGGAQPDPRSMVDGSMPELRREAEALGAGAEALADSSASWQLAGAFGLSAGLAMDLRLGYQRHLEFACSLVRFQIERGGRVLFETRGNPAVTDGTEQRKQSCEYSWCADD